MSKEAYPTLRRSYADPIAYEWFIWRIFRNRRLEDMVHEEEVGEIPAKIMCLNQRLPNEVHGAIRVGILAVQAQLGIEVARAVLGELEVVTGDYL